MAATSTLTLRIKSIGDRSIDSVTRKLLKLQTTVHGYNTISTRSLEATNVKWKQHFDAVDKGIKMFGGMLIKLVTKSAKLAALEIGLLGAAMMGVHAAFVLGNASMKAFRWLATGAAGAAAALTIAASTAAAAIREQQIAMYSYKGGKNYQNASVMMRQLAADTDMAAVGAENLNAVFAEVSKTSTFTAGSSNLLKGLMDFASAGKPLEEGAKAAGKLIAAIQDPKASFGKMKEAAKELGPEMEKAIGQLGITSAEQLKKAILDGSLSAAGGVDGQFAAVNDTLISRFKASFAIIKNQFADFGDPFLKPVKDVLENVVKTFRNTFRRVAGDISGFAHAGFFDDIGSVVEKIGNFFVKFIRDYLPKVDGMFASLGSWWDRFKEGWNMILDKLRPLIEGARVFEETLMRVLRPIGRHLSEAFGGFNEQIIANEEKFYAFGDAVGQFIGVISKYAKTVREIFIDALPFITKIINGLTGIVDLFMSLLGGFRDLFGGGGMGSFMLIAKLLVGGRAMKKTPGGVLASYGIKDVTRGASGGPLTGQTAEGNVTEGGKARAERLAKTAGAISQQRVAQMSVQSMTVMSSSDKATASARALQQKEQRDKNRSDRQKGIEEAKKQRDALRSAQVQGTSVQTQLSKQAAAETQRITAQKKYEQATGLEKIRAARELRKAQKQEFEARRGYISLPQYSPYGNAPNADYKNTFFTRNFRMSSEARAQMKNEQMAGAPMGPMALLRGYTQKGRQMRDSYGYKMIFGGNVGTKDNPVMKKGINNSMMAGMGASMGLGLLSNVMPQESQGALALGSSIAMFNPLAGLAVGVIGGAIMGIRGAAKRKKKEAIAEAQSQAEDFTSGVLKGFNDGIKDAIETGNFSMERVRQLQQNVVSQYTEQAKVLEGIIMSTLNARGREALRVGSGNFGTYDGQLIAGASTASELARLDLKGQDIMDSGKLKEMAAAQRLTGTGYFGTMSESQYNEVVKNPDAFASAMLELTNVQGEAARLVTEFGGQRLTALAGILGKTEEEVYKLSESIDNNLYNSFETTMEQVKKLAEAMINTKREMDIAAQDRFAESTNIFAQEKQSMEGKQALAEGGFAMRGFLNEAMTTTPDVLKGQMLDFFSTQMDQLKAYYKGDIALAESEFVRMFGQGGSAYTQEGGSLQGMEKVFMDLVGPQIMAVVERSQQGRTSDVSEFLKARSLGANLTLGGEGLNAITGILAQNPTAFNNISALLESTDLTTASGQDAVIKALEALDPTGQAKLKFDELVEPQLAAAEAMEAAAVKFDGATMKFDTAAQMIIDELGANDTRSPRGRIGDSTFSNLGKTMSSHSAIDSSLSGSRTVTSSYRNYALGSLKSDHVTGRALDIVGDNLVSYKDRMTKAGGFAQFHGRSNGRHLHVVPPRGGIGDSLTAVSATSSNVATTDGAQIITNNNTFNISGQNASEIAEIVMAKIAMVNKSNSERR